MTVSVFLQSTVQGYTRILGIIIKYQEVFALYEKHFKRIVINMFFTFINLNLF